MDIVNTRVYVANLNNMIRFYTQTFGAKLQDQTDLTALIQIDEDFIEFIEVDEPKTHTIGIQFTQSEAYDECVTQSRQYVSVDSTVDKSGAQNIYRARCIDAEGNHVVLYHYQMFIPTSVDSD